MADLKKRYGETALVTGASAGIGEAFARELAVRGMNLVLVARRRERLEKLKAELESRHGVRVTVLVQDLARTEAAEAVQRRLEEAGIEVDVLINNAGFGMYGEFDEMDPARELAMVDLHCRTVVDLTRRLVPAMKRRRRGAVVIVSSVLAAIPSPYLAVYAATKAFDLSFGEALYGELRLYGIDALAVMPTLTRTEFHAGANIESLNLPYRTPEQVVRTTLGALGRRPSIADGLVTRLGLFVVKFIPRRWIVRAYMKARKPPEKGA